MYPERNILLFYISLTNVSSFFSICACNLGISYPRYFPENMRARMYPMNTVVSIALYLVLVVVMDPLHDSKLNQFLMGHTVQYTHKNEAIRAYSCHLHIIKKYITTQKLYHLTILNQSGKYMQLSLSIDNLAARY